VPAGDPFGRGEEECVADVAVRIPAQERAADERLVSLGKTQQERRGDPVRRQRTLGQLG
jgi:hypothetical protein